MSSSSRRNFSGSGTISAAIPRHKPSRFIPKMTQKSLIEYINYYRIGAACDQLLSGSEPVSSIATGCGYSNISYFNRMFRKYMHCTPKEYRKAHSETPV